MSRSLQLHLRLVGRFPSPCMYQSVLCLGVLCYLYEEEKPSALLVSSAIARQWHFELISIRADWWSFRSYLHLLAEDELRAQELTAFLDEIDAPEVVSD